jgi:hypothetical protein
MAGPTRSGLGGIAEEDEGFLVEEAVLIADYEMLGPAAFAEEQARGLDGVGDVED